MTLTDQQFFDEAVECFHKTHRLLVSASYVTDYGVREIRRDAKVNLVLVDDHWWYYGRKLPPTGHISLTEWGWGVNDLVSELAGSYPDLAGVCWPDTQDGLSLARRVQVTYDRIFGLPFIIRIPSEEGVEEHIRKLATSYGLQYELEAARLEELDDISMWL